MYGCAEEASVCIAPLRMAKAAVPVDQAAAAASECAAAEAGATATDPEQQAAQRYLMLGNAADAAELGEKASATLALLFLSRR